jgi:hypothetical protein
MESDQARLPERTRHLYEQTLIIQFFLFVEKDEFRTNPLAFPNGAILRSSEREELV